MLCEYCHQKAVKATDIGPLCRAHMRAYDNGASFEGCVTRTAHELLQDIHKSPLARYLMREVQRRERMSGSAVLRDYGDLRTWPSYHEALETGWEPPPEAPRPPVVGTHEHWAVHQNHWDGSWYIQRGVRQGLGTAYDPPLPGHSGFQTKREAVEFKRGLLC